MSKWKGWLANVLDKVEDGWDSLKTTVKTKLNLFDPLEILVFNCYASDNQVFVFGRVLENKAIPEGEADDSWWENLKHSYQRMNTDEVKDAKLQVVFQGKSYETTSDEEGYFNFKLDISEATLPNELEIKLLDAPVPHEKNIIGKSPIFKPSANAQIAIVSDIDDTILVTDATSLLNMAKNTFLKSVQNRRTFVGVSELYHALLKGKNEDAYQPISYVSSSPWNLHELLNDFLELNKIPDGTLFLRDYGVDKTKILVGTHGDHKYMAIKHLLDIYPKLSFVLIGDSGQEDAKIYRTVAKDFPNRIAAIYIRDAKVEKKKAWMEEQLAEAKKDGIEILWSEDSLDFARDAFSKNLISEQGLESVKNAKLM